MKKHGPKLHALVGIILTAFLAACGTPAPAATPSPRAAVQPADEPTGVWADNKWCGSMEQGTGYRGQPVTKHCELQVGEIGYVRLAEVGNLPYRWQVTEIDPARLELVDESALYESRECGEGGEPQLPGSPCPNDRIIRFRARSAGETTLTVSLRHVSGTPEPEREEALSVTLSIR